MPRDLEAELARRQSETDQLISGIPIKRRRSLLDNQAQLNQQRGNFVNQAINPRLGMLGMRQTGATASPISALARELSRSTAGGIFGAQRQNLDLGMQTKQRRAQEATNRLLDTYSYLRQLSSDDMRRGFESEQLQADIEAAKRKEALADEYAQRGVALQDSYLPDMGYEAALTRALFGLGGSLGSAYLLNKNQKQPTSTPMQFNQSPFGRTELPYGPSNSLGYYPQRPTGGYK